ncbi:MAG: 3-dehydroquinate synthase [Candidatus Omnitrophota bacterium]
MKAIKVNLKKRSYDIIVGFGIIKLLPKFITRLGIGRDAYIITNASIRNKYGDKLSKILRQAGFGVRFKTVPDTEKSKSVEMAASLVKDIARYDKKKRIFIIAFGGGVIGDLAGFTASIYKRGIPYIQIPTTLLAQVDSSIGGKTAVDLSEGKNLVGAFYQPALVLSDIKFLNTLDQRQIRAGLAEVIKYGIIKDRQLFSFLERKYRDVLKLNPDALEYILKRSSSIKAGIVSKDEREEKGLRTVLNFGHTIGHAIEAACGYKAFNHGEALALGMLVAADISRSLSLLSKDAYGRIENLIKNIGLPTKIKGTSLQRIINAHYRDKKFTGKKNRFVLIEGIGKTKIIENIPVRVIREAIIRRSAS